jgi:hypothetical protein
LFLYFEQRVTGFNCKDVCVKSIIPVDNAINSTRQPQQKMKWVRELRFKFSNSNNWKLIRAVWFKLLIGNCWLDFQIIVIKWVPENNTFVNFYSDLWRERTSYLL